MVWAAVVSDVGVLLLVMMVVVVMIQLLLMLVGDMIKSIVISGEGCRGSS